MSDRNKEGLKKAWQEDSRNKASKEDWSDMDRFIKDIFNTSTNLSLADLLPIANIVVETMTETKYLDHLLDIPPNKNANKQSSAGGSGRPTVTYVNRKIKPESNMSTLSFRRFPPDNFVDPFTNTNIEIPVRNVYCEHVYDKTVSFRLLRKKFIRCPVDGCKNRYTLKKKDLPIDDELLGAIKSKKTPWRYQVIGERN